MSSCLELQEEELLVLRSIYQGDDCFKEIGSNVFQYKIGDDQDSKSFLLELSWGENYPQEPPTISMDAFYNKHILSEVKQHVIQTLLDEATQLLDMAMTFSLFEYAKENREVILQKQPDVIPQDSVEEIPSKVLSNDCFDSSNKTKEKKEHLTKAQKRKLYNRQDNKGEMPRGWNWVDIVKHLSQTGKSDSAATSGNT